MIRYFENFPLAVGQPVIEVLGRPDVPSRAISRLFGSKFGPGELPLKAFDDAPRIRLRRDFRNQRRSPSFDFHRPYRRPILGESEKGRVAGQETFDRSFVPLFAEDTSVVDTRVPAEMLTHASWRRVGYFEIRDEGTVSRRR